MQATPVKTAWSGSFYDKRSAKWTAMRFDDLIFAEEGQLLGSGEDEVGKFELNGTYGRKHIQFKKQYLGAHFICYKGYFTEAEEGQAINGQWGFKFGEPQDDFKLLRSKELEKKREAAFKAEVARVKMVVGISRVVFEDIGFCVIKLLYVIKHATTSSQLIVTGLSLAASLFMTLAGPWLERKTARKMRDLAGEVKPPVIADGKRQANTASHSKAASLADGYTPLTDGERASRMSEGDKVYDQRLETAKEITTLELFTGNLDYIAVLMEHTHRPAEVIDMAITDVIAATPIVRNALCLSSGIFWFFCAISPLVFEVTCDGGLPAPAVMGFFVSAFFNIFVQLWCAALTKYGYLMLAHAPQMFAFDIGLSFMGLFSSFSSVQWVMMARACDSWLWKPGLGLFVLGMIILQAMPGLYFLVNAKKLPWALRLTMNNLLLALLKPEP